jgi:hypothetical protein
MAVIGHNRTQTMMNLRAKSVSTRLRNPVIGTLVACSSGLAFSSPRACEMDLPPLEARLVIEAKDLGTVTFPVELPVDFSGCQRFWAQFERSRDKSIPLADVYYVKGRPVRFLSYAMSAERTAIVDCRYRNDSLDAEKSLNSERCPPASELVKASNDKAFMPAARPSR